MIIDSPTHHSDSLTRRVGDSPTCRVRELTTPWLAAPDSDSASRGVNDSPTHRTGKFSFKHSIVDSPNRRVGDLSIPRLAESASCFSITNISENSKPKSDGLKCSVRDQCRTDLCKNLGKSASLPCPFKITVWRVILRGLAPRSLPIVRGWLLFERTFLAPVWSMMHRFEWLLMRSVNLSNNLGLFWWTCDYVEREASKTLK